MREKLYGKFGDDNEGEGERRGRRQGKERNRGIETVEDKN